MAGLGGALAPTSSMPDWAQAVAPFTPVYWTLKAMGDLTLKDVGIADVNTSLLVTAGCTVLFTIVAVLRFRPSDTKAGTT